MKYFKSSTLNRLLMPIRYIHRESPNPHGRLPNLPDSHQISQILATAPRSWPDLPDPGQILLPSQLPRSPRSWPDLPDPGQTAPRRQTWPDLPDPGQIPDLTTPGSQIPDSDPPQGPLPDPGFGPPTGQILARSWDLTPPDPDLDPQKIGTL